MRRALIITAGVALAIAALWAGSYAAWAFDWNDWRQFPSIMTALTAFVGGVGLTLWGSYPTWGTHT